MFENYTKKQRNEIWDDYCLNKLKKFEWITYKQRMSFDFTKQAPCPVCLKTMNRSQYIFSKQNVGKKVWKIGFLSKNKIETLDNLIPVHDSCQ